ncbi:MAG: hypothetical protein RCO49_01315 [Rickettsia endosymbiont of Argas persicus]
MEQQKANQKVFVEKINHDISNVQETSKVLDDALKKMPLTGDHIHHHDE